MKKFYYSALIVALAAFALFASFTVFAQRSQRQRIGRAIVESSDVDIIGRIEIPTVSPNLVISQFQAGGPTNANDEFIEIHNNGAAPVDLNGYRLVYRASAGTGDVNFYNWTTSAVVQPGQYYLVASSVYAGPTPKDAGWDSATCACGLSATTGGGLAIRQGALNTGTVIDTVGWGTGTNIFVEGTRTTVPPNGGSKRRLGGGCTDTDNNAADFETVTPSSPRNMASGAQPCGAGGTTIFASMQADPTTVVPSANTLLTVTVVGATTPPSTAIQVFGNLTQIGGSNLQQFYDDGTHGDVTAGDNVFTFDALIPANATGGTKNITAVASDAEMRSANTAINITVSIPGEAENPLLFGNPTNATANTAFPDNYLMIKPQYTLSYNNSTREPNWTAWRLDSTWIGSSGRSGTFAPDTTLPAGFVQVQPADYSEPVYDRGHMCPSGDRTRSTTDNQATFLMTNMVPQLPDNNQGPWADFENYCRTLAGQGKEIYIISGPQGTIFDPTTGMAKTIGTNQVVVPKWTWKVVLVLPNGTDDLHRVGKYTRVFGVIMSNEAITRSAPWRNFRVTVDQVEALTGYDFFSALPVNLQTRIESQPDTQ